MKHSRGRRNSTNGRGACFGDVRRIAFKSRWDKGEHPSNRSQHTAGIPYTERTSFSFIRTPFSATRRLPASVTHSTLKSRRHLYSRRSVTMSTPLTSRPLIEKPSASSGEFGTEEDLTAEPGIEKEVDDEMGELSGTPASPSPRHLS